MRALLSIVLGLGLLGTPACGPKATPANIPGALSTPDAQIYVELRDIQEAISAAQDQQASHPSLKPLLDNQVGPAYQKVKDAYVAYHQALVAGGPPSPDKSAAILTQIEAVRAALTAALKSSGASK